MAMATACPIPEQDLLRSEDAPAAGDGGLRIVSSRPLLRYQPDGRSANSNLTVHVCVDGRISGQVIVNNLGRVRTSYQKAGSPCPTPMNSEIPRSQPCRVAPSLTPADHALKWRSPPE